MQDGDGIRMRALMIVLTTVPDCKVGAEIGRTVVQEDLAACVNLLPGVRSFYLWQGGLQEDEEALLIAKVRKDRFDAYERRMAELHPYEVPEIVALPAERVSEGYLKWCLGEGE
ncbi:MAG: divalent-cation tolerance protein CutA [Planctomycetota bacterium]